MSYRYFEMATQVGIKTKGSKPKVKPLDLANKSQVYLVDKQLQNMYEVTYREPGILYVQNMATGYTMQVTESERQQYWALDRSGTLPEQPESD